MLRRMRHILATRRSADIALLVVITLLATRGWLNLQMPTGHDAMADMLVARGASESLFEYQVFGGWNGDWYLGYPLFSVHPPLVHQLIIAFSLPFGWILGTKLLYLSFFILSGVFAYLYVFDLTRSRPGAFAAGLAYVFLPYHILEVAFEGHHGVFGLPYMLTPLALLCLERLVRQPSAGWVLANAALLSCLTLTYPQVLPLLIGPFLVAYLALRLYWERRKGGAYLKKAVAGSVATFCLTLMLTSFWWLPLLSEIRYSAATSFTPDASLNFSATFWQAVTLRPSFCCARASAYGASGNAFKEMLRLLPFLLVALGAALNYRSRYVWFFSGSILFAILLAMGQGSPVDLFSLAHRWVPLFSGLRTPWRFLLFASLAYSVLIGFCVKSLTGQLGRIRLPEGARPVAAAVVAGLLCLTVVGTTWVETRAAFRTFSLTAEQEGVFEWLKEQQSGDARVASLPFSTWTHSDEYGWVVSPVHWVYLHGKDDAYGGVPAAATAYAGDALDHLTNRQLNGSSIDRWLDLYGVRYVLIDRTDPASAGISLGEGFRLIRPGAAMDVYENSSPGPRLFSVSAADQRHIALWTGDEIRAAPAYGEMPLAFSLDEAHALSGGRSLKTTFRFAHPGPQRSGLAIDLGGIPLDGDDALRLEFYSESPLPDVGISLDVLESDGSRYGLDMDRIDGISAGWNEIEIPLSLLLLRDSDDEDHLLDPDQVATLWLGAFEIGEKGHGQDVDLYFAAVSAVSQKMDTVEYSRTGTGRYLVHIDSSSAFKLVLADSYYPSWVARSNGETIRSEITYQSLNGFDLPAGAYDVTLEFTHSRLRNAGAVISIITLLALLALSALVLGTELRRRRLNSQGSSHGNRA